MGICWSAKPNPSPAPAPASASAPAPDPLIDPDAAPTPPGHLIEGWCLINHDTILHIFLQYFPRPACRKTICNSKHSVFIFFFIFTLN